MADELEPFLEIPEPKKDESDDQKSIVDIQDIVGLFKFQNVVPTGTPRKFSEQVRVVVTGGNASLYVYDQGSALWRSATLIST